MHTVTQQPSRKLWQRWLGLVGLLLTGIFPAAFGALGLTELSAQDVPVNLATYRLTDRDAELLRTLIPVDIRDRKGVAEMEDPAFRSFIGELQAIQEITPATKEQLRNGTLDPEAKIRQLVGPFALPPGVRLNLACTAQLFPTFQAVYLPVAAARASGTGAGAAALARRANPQMDSLNAQVLTAAFDYTAEWTAFLNSRYPVVEGGPTSATYSRRADDPLKITVDLQLGLQCDASGKTPAIIGVKIPDGAWLGGTLAKEPLPPQRRATLPEALQGAGITQERYAEILLKALGARRSAAFGGEVEDPPPHLDSPEYKAMREAERANLRWWARHAASLESLLSEYEREGPAAAE